MKKRLTAQEIASIVATVRGSQDFIAKVYPNVDLGVGSGWAALNIVLRTCGEPERNAPWLQKETSNGR